MEASNRAQDMIDQYGFPLYVYEEAAIYQKISSLKESLPNFDIFYSIKTNPNKHIRRYMSRQGLGADVASVGEVVKALESGFEKNNILYSSPGKTANDIEQALDKAILVADSYNELALINEICEKRGRKAQVGLRINPNYSMNIDANLDQFKGFASKFGVDEEGLISQKNFIDKLKFVEITGIHVFLRSQVLNEEILCNYFDKVFGIAAFCITEMKWDLTFIDFGGGFGIPYTKEEQPIDWMKLHVKLQELIDSQEVVSKNKVRFIVESGRFLVSEAGSFLTQIVDVKESRGQKFVIVHGGLSGFLRPSIMNIIQQMDPRKRDKPLEPLFSGVNTFEVSILNKTDRPSEEVTVAGNLCTANDVIARDIVLPAPQRGDIVCVNNAGAYGYTLSPYDFSSHSRPREIYLSADGIYLLE